MSAEITCPWCDHTGKPLKAHRSRYQKKTARVCEVCKARLK